MSQAADRSADTRRMTLYSRALAAVAVLSLAAGCVSTHMKQFIGRDVRYITVQDGPPVAVFDLPDRVRAFQYRWGGGTYTLPATSTTAGQVQIVGRSAFYQEQTLTTAGQVYTSEGCLVTYFARWDTHQRGWIVQSIDYPKRLFC